MQGTALPGRPVETQSFHHPPGAEAGSTDLHSQWFCIRKSLILLPHFPEAPLIKASLGNPSGFLNGLGKMASQRAGGVLPPDQTRSRSRLGNS